MAPACNLPHSTFLSQHIFLPPLFTSRPPAAILCSFLYAINNVPLSFGVWSVLLLLPQSERRNRRSRDQGKMAGHASAQLNILPSIGGRVHCYRRNKGQQGGEPSMNPAAAPGEAKQRREQPDLVRISRAPGLDQEGHPPPASPVHTSVSHLHDCRHAVLDIEHITTACSVLAGPRQGPRQLRLPERRSPPLASQDALCAGRRASYGRCSAST